MCSAVRTSLRQQHISISISTFCYWTEQCWCRDNGTQLLGRQQQQQRPLTNFFSFSLAHSLAPIVSAREAPKSHVNVSVWLSVRLCVCWRCRCDVEKEEEDKCLIEFAFDRLSADSLSDNCCSSSSRPCEVAHFGVCSPSVWLVSDLADYQWQVNMHRFNSRLRHASARSLRHWPEKGF